MFPDTITVYNIKKTQTSTTYERKIVNNVFSHKTKIISSEGNGEKYTSVYNVIFSNIALQKYVDKIDEIDDEHFTLQKNDVIVLGESKEIKNLSELEELKVDYFLIKTISENRYGLDKSLNNIEVTN